MAVGTLVAVDVDVATTVAVGSTQVIVRQALAFVGCAGSNAWNDPTPAKGRLARPSVTSNGVPLH